MGSRFFPDFAETRWLFFESPKKGATPLSPLVGNMKPNGTLVELEDYRDPWLGRGDVLERVFSPKCAAFAERFQFDNSQTGLGFMCYVSILTHFF